MLWSLLLGKLCHLANKCFFNRRHIQTSTSILHWNLCRKLQLQYFSEISATKFM